MLRLLAAGEGDLAPTAPVEPLLAVTVILEYPGGRMTAAKFGHPAAAIDYLGKHRVE